MPKLVKRWPYATTSAGRYRGTLEGRMKCWEAEGPARTIFNTELDTKIKDYIVNNLPESYSFIGFSLFMVGRMQAQTNPTVLIVSDDKPRRKAAFKAIKSSGLLDQYPGFHVAHCRLAAEFEDLQQMAEERFITRGHYDPPKTDCGIYISYSDDPDGPLFAHDHASSGSNGAMATIGGLLRVGTIYYAFTVAHVLAYHAPHSEFNEPPHGFTSSPSDSPDFETTAMDDLDDESDLDELCSASSEDSTNFPGDSSNNEDSSSEQHESKTDSSPSTSSQQPEENSPAAQSVETMPAPKELAILYHHPNEATTIIYTSNSLDIMLLKINSPYPFFMFLPLRVRVVSITSFAKITNVSIGDGINISVQTHTAVLSGRLSATSFHAQLQGSRSFQKLYLAQLSTPLRPGDCGSWATTGNTESLVGIVVAASPKTGSVLILPGRTIFECVERQLAVGKG
ncbi:hypothetical protein F5Y19DRAFT_229099 [Xylariaceae sp. FL1651]|nr:hypothetical protein F5Y19DRAFT_229099 [Xylariaceae sp. FL1651]